jgi:dUTP pyrophosphatase
MVAIQFAKVRPDARIPQKRSEDAGYDLYACFDEPYQLIAPHQTRLIPLGIASAFPEDYVFVVKERGSTGVRGMAQRSGVIDSGFRGEWMLPITNTGTEPLAIVKAGETAPEGAAAYPYEKAIAQALLLPVPQTEIQEMDYRALSEIPSKRGTGMLGSSGK